MGKNDAVTSAEPYVAFITIVCEGNLWHIKPSGWRLYFDSSEESYIEVLDCPQCGKDHSIYPTK